MLIIGSNGGVGKECIKYFSENYDVISISRDLGDLRDKEFLKKIIDEYDNDTTIDLDGSIYSQGLFTKDEFSTIRTFHSISNNEKLDFLKKLEFSRIKNLGLRLIFRNYP